MKDFKYITFGITNQCKNDYLIPFFDFDNQHIENVLIDLQHIQDVFKLSHIYIILSENGYNAFSLDKLDYKTLKEIYEQTQNVDNQFIKWGLNRGFMTLRMSDRKKLYKIIKSNNFIYMKSTPHKWFFNEIMEYNIQDIVMFDNENQITITSFPSNKHGYEIGSIKNGNNQR